MASSYISFFKLFCKSAMRLNCDIFSTLCLFSNFACRAFLRFSCLISRFRVFEFVISSMFSQSFLVENAEEPSHNFSFQTVQLCIFILNCIHLHIQIEYKTFQQYSEYTFERYFHHNWVSQSITFSARIKLKILKCCSNIVKHVRNVTVSLCE